MASGRSSKISMRFSVDRTATEIHRMGSIFAILAAQYVGGMENLILVSPTHVPFEGTHRDKKTMTGHMEINVLLTNAGV